MATSRTGTTRYLRNRARVLRQAIADGLTHCPCGCGRLLDYETPGLDNSAEVHHSLRVHLAHGHEWYHPHAEVLALVNQWRSELGQPPLEW